MNNPEKMKEPKSTGKVFWEDPYLTELKTKITGVNGNDVTVEQAILYAFSGGQESDEGTIEGRRVLQARKEGKNIIYTLESSDNLNVGDEVTMNIDWERRYNLMKLHFAAEIVLELMYKKFPSIEKIGAHIASDKARLDFKYEGEIKDILFDIENSANEIIKANKAIKSDFSDKDDEKRYWEIPGFAKVPCGGTHIKTTGEIGQIELKRKNIGRGKERIEIYLR